MSVDKLPNEICIDGAVEIVRCRDLQAGWPNETLQTSFDLMTWSLPPELNARKEAWERHIPAERSDPKIALRSISVKRSSAPLFRLQATSWNEVRPLHVGTPISKREQIRVAAGACEFLLPNICVVHVIATTQDGWALSFKRGQHSHYHPGAWSTTYEEGLSPEDLRGGGLFHEAARRGLAEEISAELLSVPLNSFKVVSVIVETAICNPAVVVVAELPIRLSQLPTSRPSDELEAHCQVAIPLELKPLRDFMLTSKIGHNGANIGSHHPTSRYRLLMLVAQHFGETAASDILRGMRAQSQE